MVTISAYVIAYNEEAKIEQTLNGLLWADEIVVGDSFSTDRTADIAEAMGARVVQVPFEGFGKLRNSVIEACTGDWIISLDADERCTEAVRDEILEITRAGDAQDVYFVPRRNYFMGRWIRHSGFYPNYRQPQLFRRGAMSYRPEPVHEGFRLHTDRSPGYLKNAIWQVPFKDFEEILRKADKYSSLGAGRMVDAGEPCGMFRALGHGVWSFVQHWILKRGFLDGWPGFVIALGNFEGTFYKYAKCYHRQRNWELPDCPPLHRPGDPH
jgi:glycosyltransferase involved in cell wall biosynthesis